MKEFPPARRYMLPLGSLEWVDFTGQTAFIRAAQSADVEVMRLLLAKGADPRITTFNGTNALMVAAGVNWVIGQTYGSRVARGGAAVPRARLRRERGEPDGARGRARRGQPRLGRHHRAARERAARGSTWRTRKGARR